MSSFEAIQSDVLHNVSGGADNGYNGGDGVRAAAGGFLGFLGGGPLGAIVGTAAGFTSRKVGELADGVNDLMNERKRAADLEAKRQEMLRNRPQGK